MSNILSQLLAKRGIKDKSELSNEERVDFSNWEKILEEEQVTVPSLLEFIDGEIGMIQAQFNDLDRSHNKTERLIMQMSVYNRLKDVMTSKKAERESLIEYLTTLL